MLQFFGPNASIHGLDARIVTFWNIMQVKCKLDVAIPSLKHTETVHPSLKMTLPVKSPHFCCEKMAQYCLRQLQKEHFKSVY